MAVPPPLSGCASPRGDRERASVGRGSREELVGIPIAADRHGRAAVRRNPIDIIHIAGKLVRIREEVQPLAIARPAVELIESVVVGHAPDVAGRKRQDVDVAAASARRHERKPGLVG